MTHKERRTTPLSPLWLGVAVLWVLLVGLSLLADTTAAHGGEKDSHEHEHQPHGAGLAAQYELEKKQREEKAAKQAASQRNKEQFKMPELSRADKAIFMELFNSKKNVTSRWTFTNNEVYNGKWRIDYPPPPQGLPGDKALIAKLERPPDAERYSAHVLFSQPLVNTPGQDLIIQYDVRFQQDHCAGAYIKLLSATEGPLAEKKPLEMDSSTPFVIMFGPDRCGDDDKVHFIFRNYNQNTKKLEEKHLKNPPGVAGRNDWWTHHYALHINRDNTFDILLDNVKVRSGSLFTEFEPSVNPPKVIPDPDHKKPASWDDRKEIADPLAVPPSNWDEDEMLQVPCSDLGRCGSQNNCFVKRGVWKAPRIPNPKYSGEWVQRTIPNPKFYEDKEPTRFSPIAGLGFELLTSSNHLMIDNILVTHDKELAAEFVKKTWEPKLAAERAAEQAKAEVQRKHQAERGEKIAKEKAERARQAKLPKTEEEAMLWKEQALHAKWEQGQFDLESLKEFGEFLVYKYKSWGIVGLRWIENHPYHFVGILATFIALRFLVKAITRKSPKKDAGGGSNGTPSKKKNKKKKTTKAE